MNEFLQLPDTFLGWATLFGFVLFGGFSIYGQFNRERKQAETEADETSDRVIQLLKDQVDALEKKVMEQEEILKDTKKKLESLIEENRLLREVLQGRDTETLAFQTRATYAMGEVNQTLQLVSRIDENVKKLIGSTVIETKTKKIKRI